MITVEEYREAEKIVNNHKICAGCEKIFEIKDVTETVQYGQIKHWCILCYEKIKDDW